MVFVHKFDCWLTIWTPSRTGVRYVNILNVLFVYFVIEVVSNARRNNLWVRFVNRRILHQDELSIIAVRFHKKYEDLLKDMPMNKGLQRIKRTQAMFPSISPSLSLTTLVRCFMVHQIYFLWPINVKIESISIQVAFTETVHLIYPIVMGPILNKSITGDWK